MERAQLYKLQVQVEFDSDWFFGQSEAELGICSNMSSIINHLRTGGDLLHNSKPFPDDPYNEKVFQAVHKRRFLQKKFDRLTNHNYLILFNSFVFPVNKLPPEIRLCFQDHSGAAITIFTDAQLQKIVKMAHKPIDSTTTLFKTDLKMKAKSAFDLAVIEYSKINIKEDK